jgi:small subunit ribosomal protein S3
MLMQRIVAYNIAEQLEKRLPFRRVMKQTIEKIMAARGVKGGKIVLSGRLGGADMARREEIKLGGIPLQFMRGDIDFATDTARMTYGGVGIKVWIYKGDTHGTLPCLPKKTNDADYFCLQVCYFLKK